MGATCDRRVRAVGGSPEERLLAFEGIAQHNVGAPEVERAARRCLRDSRWDTAAACLEVVQRLPYYPDPPGADDWIGHPCHVLTIGGDCEDLATLLVSLWATCGLTGRLVWLTQPASGQDHVGAEVKLGGRWVWGESTVQGARLGEDPYKAAARLGALRDGAL